MSRVSKQVELKQQVKDSEALAHLYNQVQLLLLNNELPMDQALALPFALARILEVKTLPRLVKKKRDEFFRDKVGAFLLTYFYNIPSIAIVDQDFRNTFADVRSQQTIDRKIENEVDQILTNIKRVATSNIPEAYLSTNLPQGFSEAIIPNMNTSKNLINDILTRLPQNAAWGNFAELGLFSYEE